MIRRRHAHESLEPSGEPRWLTVRSFSGGLLEYRRLEPGTDLVRTYLVAMLELVDAGWRLGEFGSTSAAVRHERGTEKRMLAVESVDPEESRIRPAWPGQCTACED